jgi:GAF domain-containing protein
LANQVAVGIRNARLFTEVNTALIEARALQAQYISQAWSQAQAGGRDQAWALYSRAGAAVLSEVAMEEARKHLLDEQALTTVAIEDKQTVTTAVIAPVKVQDTPIGQMQIHGLDPGRALTESELAMIEAVLDQVAQTAENLRLFEETQERASRERLVGQVSDRLRRAPNMEALMKTAVGELARILGPDRAFVRLGSEAELGIGNDSGLDNGEPPVDADAALTDPAVAELFSRSQTSFPNSVWERENESNLVEHVDDNGNEPKLTGNGQTIEDPKGLTDL